MKGRHQAGHGQIKNRIGPHAQSAQPLSYPGSNRVKSEFRGGKAFYGGWRDPTGVDDRLNSSGQTFTRQQFQQARGFPSGIHQAALPLHINQVRRVHADFFAQSHQRGDAKQLIFGVLRPVVQFRKRQKPAIGMFTQLFKRQHFEFFSAEKRQAVDTGRVRRSPAADLAALRPELFRQVENETLVTAAGPPQAGNEDKNFHYPNSSTSQLSLQAPLKPSSPSDPHLLSSALPLPSSTPIEASHP